MGVKDEFDKLTNAVTDAVDGAVQSIKHDAQIAASKAAHHSAARAQEVKRADAGDSLSPLDVSRSVVTQLREETLAVVDSIRQTIRKNI